MKTLLLLAAALALSAEGAPVTFDALPAATNSPTAYWFNPKIDANGWAGKPCMFEVTAKGETGTELTLYIETQGKAHRSTPLRMRLRDGVARTCRVGMAIPEDAREIHARIDYKEGGGKATVQSARFGLADDFAPFPRNAQKDASPEPKRLFRADFDGTLGKVQPLMADEVTFEPGVSGQAVRLGAKSALAYPFAGNVRAARGTVLFWAKADRALIDDTTRNAVLFAFPMSDFSWGRWGTGAVCFWHCLWGGLRADLSDIDDRQVDSLRAFDHGWHAYAMTWDVDDGMRLFIDGIKYEPQGNFSGQSPTAAAHQVRDGKPFVHSPAFDRFFVGSVGPIGATSVNTRFLGLIDEMEIWDRPLSDEAIKAKAAAFPQVRAEKGASGPDWKQVFAAPNAYTKPLAEGAASGVPDDLELLEEVVFDKIPVNGERTRITGASRMGELDGVKYLELDPKSRAGRFAQRFTLDRAVPFYVFEVDYPDDKARTADICIEDAQNFYNDYSLGSGYIVGDEYRTSGKMKTIRYLYWTSGKDVAFLLMTARQNQPAAVAKIRVYRSKSAKLPAMPVVEPPTVDGWTRSIGFYWEDPAIGYDFGLRSQGGKVSDYREIVDRTVAYMKYTGLNFFAYPASWYGGIIGTDQNPRPHAPQFLQAWYERFDREGFSFMPIVNTHEMPIDPNLITYRSARDGSLLGTEVNIMGDTGLPPGGGTHGTPPAWCFYHPKVQANINRILDHFLEEGAPHPSFKGIALHLTYHPFLHWGEERSGYNDYCIDGFLKSAKGLKGLEKLAAVDRKDPMRAKAYYNVLKGDPELWKAWLDWRCDVLVDFYAAFAEKMRRRRPDLKLWFNSMITMNTWRFDHPKYGTPDWVEYQALGAGFDAAKITARIPNAIVGQTSVPADYRWRYIDRPKDATSDRLAAYQRGQELSEGLWRACKKAAFPFAHQHDRYWEDAVGKKNPAFWFGAYLWQPGDTEKYVLSGDWLKETDWRVSTINPAGRNALRSFVAPLIHSDCVGLTKGGFLIGFYGEEDVLAPWAREFRKLPAVKLPTLREATAADPVLVRGGEVAGKRYVYLLNTSDRPATTTWRIGGTVKTYRLDAYELKAEVEEKPLPQKVILDTDMGGDVDDALALACLLRSPDCDLLGVTVEAWGGNGPRQAEIASAICRDYGRDVPIAIGPGAGNVLGRRASRQPEKPPRYWPIVKGRDYKQFTPRNDAVDFLQRTIRANPGEVTLVAVGHYTNLGALFAVDPEIPSLLKRLVVMGGELTGQVEWNASYDPIATAAVFANGNHARPPETLVVSADVTSPYHLTKEEARRFFAGIPSLSLCAAAAEYWFADGHDLWFSDPIAAQIALDPELATWTNATVSVSLSGGLTAVDAKPDPNRGVLKVATAVDFPRFRERFVAIMRKD